MDNSTSLLLGVFIGGGISMFFYSIGRADSEISGYRNLMLDAIFRLKQMTPTTRTRVEGGFNLSETENYLTCISETIGLIRWPEGAKALITVVSDMQNLEHYQEPNERQRAEREAKKKEWEAHLFRQVEEALRWKTRLLLSLPQFARQWVDSQLLD